MDTFLTLGIAPELLEILNRLQWTIPTPIQQKTIPIALEGKDIIGIAQTGTGKTLAFALPIVQRLASLKGKIIVILPTRELAIQVDETFQKIGRMRGLRTAVLIGGAPIGRQIQQLRNHPHVIVGTPGRIIDHLQQRTLQLNDVQVLVLDEADRMLDMGFAPQIKKILQVIPKERQTMLFSATMPNEIVKIATMHMKLPVRVEIVRPGTTADRVEQEVFIIKANEKNRLLEALLKQHLGTVLVFTRTKFGAKKVCKGVRLMGHTAAEIHSNRSLPQRQEALQGFRSGKYRVLVATDIAARGIDVQSIAVVINYDMPEQAEDYVHRIGRTARAGQAGRAITFATPDQSHKIRHIERLIRAALRVSKIPELPPDRPIPRDENDRSERPPYRGSRTSRPSYGRGGHSGGYGGRRDGKRSGGYGGSGQGGSSGHSSGLSGQQPYKPRRPR